MPATIPRFIAQTRPDATVLLELWLDHSSEDERAPIGIRGEPAYRYFWRTWMRFLENGKNGVLSQALPWYEVTPGDVLAFLAVGPRGRQINTDPKVITKRRYWRLLERIYAFALENGWVEQNSVSQLAYRDVPPPEDPRGLIMLPGIWRAATEILGDRVDERPLAIRNRAICGTLFELALMPMELRELTLESLVRRQQSDGSHSLYAIQVDGPGVGQLRKMTLSDELRKDIQAWLSVRYLVAKSSEQRALFCARTNTAELITATQLINIVTKLLRQASAVSGYPLPARLGPQIVRNTRLVMWLNEGVPPQQVAVWAGLKDARGLYHLRQHINPEINLLGIVRE